MEADLDLLTKLILGAYVWSTALAGWLYEQIRRVRRNEIAHLETRVSALERRASRK